MSDLDLTDSLDDPARHGPASWRGRGSPRFGFAQAQESHLSTVLPLAVAALAAAAGLAAWLVSNWTSA